LAGWQKPENIESNFVMHGDITRIFFFVILAAVGVGVAVVGKWEM